MPEKQMPVPVIRKRIRRRRWEIVQQLSHMLEFPMIILAFAWVALFVYTIAVPGANPLAKDALAIIWYVFAADFLLRFLVAPSKRDFLKHNWIGAMSLLLPALRSLQIIPAMSTLYTMSLLSGSNSLVLVLLGSVHRGIRALHKLLRRRATAYVVMMTLMVLLAGAGGMLAFERDVPSKIGIYTYPQALYWTMMLLSTIGSDYWPQTAQGKLLCVALSLYAVGILSYVAATLASFFIGSDAADPKGDIASEQELRELKREIRNLRRQLHRCMNHRHF
jgi:voltage-gated potassium channel